MIYSTRFVVMLDACVLYPAPIRDILLNLAEQELYSPKWSKIIEEEWLRNLLANRPDLVLKNLERTIRAMNNAFPDAMVSSFQNIIETIELPDANDRHVLAAGIVSKSDFIVTFNLKDFPQKYLNKFGIFVIDPDSFICGLYEIDNESVIQGFENQLASLKNPSKTKKELKAILEKCGLSKSSKLF